ncbi:MAG: hypothetical protein WC057_09035 [Dehalococcoidales bacterium]
MPEQFDLPYECPKRKGLYFFSASSCRARMARIGSAKASWSNGGATAMMYEECIGCTGPVLRKMETIQEEKIVEVVKKDKKTCEEQKKSFVCEIHGEHQGGTIAGLHSDQCPKCLNEKRLSGLAKANQGMYRLHVADKPWLAQWLRDQAANGGDGAIRAAIERIVIEQIPSEYIKDWYLKEGKA